MLLGKCEGFRSLCGHSLKLPLRAHFSDGCQRVFWSSFLPEHEGQEMLQGTGSWSLEVSVFAEMWKRGAPGLRSWGLSLWAGPPPWRPGPLCCQDQTTTASNDSSFRSRADCVPGAVLSILLALSPALLSSIQGAALLSPGVGLAPRP